MHCNFGAKVSYAYKEVLFQENYDMGNLWLVGGVGGVTW